MSITRTAMSASRMTFFAAALIFIAGTLAFLRFPSQEEPTVTVREASVSVTFPGMGTERVETLLAKPLEEQFRSIAGIKRIATTIHVGSAVIQLTAQDDVDDLPALWQQVRARAADLASQLPQGAIGPFVDDDYGKVAVASIAVTAPGFSMSEMRGPLQDMRAQLYALKGVQRVTLHGLQEDRIYLEFSRGRLLEAGVTPALIISQLREQNITEPGGLASMNGIALSLHTTGETRSLETLRRLTINVPGPGGDRQVPLAALAQIRLMPADPPESAAVYQGKPAVVLAVSMAPGYNMDEFGKALRAQLDKAGALLPAGFTTHVVTYQPEVVDREMSKMHHVMAETVVIVMAVVMLFLGWRTGLIVGAIVPLTILGTLIAMRALDIELQAVSIAAIILALGLLVDNGIVIAEDIERRLAAGEERRSACERAGKTLAIPLLTSSLAIILAFSPFFFGHTSTNEYLRSLAVVLALSLFGSWLLSITVTPLLCFHFTRLKPGAQHGEEHYDTPFYRGYRRIISAVLRHNVVFIGAMVLALAGGVVIITSIPYDFLPKSDRLQFQVPITLEPGTDARTTLKSVKVFSAWLADKQRNPEITDSIGYVADGGPRIVLGLNPPQSAPNVAYFTVSVAPDTNIDAVIERVNHYALLYHPEMRAEAKRFSLGSTESGVAVYRIVGRDEAVLRDAAGRIASALRRQRGTVDIYDDWGERVPRFVIDVDQAKARRAGVSSADIAQALQMRFGGVAVSVIRDNGTSAPIVLRGTERDRDGVQGAPGDTLIYSQNGGVPTPLAAVATISVGSENPTIIRYNLEPAITITGRNPGMTAGEIVAALEPTIHALNLPPGYRVELGGEMEDADEVNDSLMGTMPYAVCAILLLFVWQFNSFRKVFIVVSSVPFVLIGASLALLLTGYPFGFMATFGLLALGGIIVNNAVLLLERIEAEVASGLAGHEAVVSAAIKRLRPIVMTKLTCIVGLIPLMLFAGPLWTGMAITMIGGLALGTLVTLGLIPALYDLLFKHEVRSAAPEVRHAH